MVLKFFYTQIAVMGNYDEFYFRESFLSLASENLVSGMYKCL